MARETTSRVCNGSVNAAPRSSISTPPKPRNASVIRNEGLLGLYSMVGWNCINSMLPTRAPARHAMATPSPEATGGLVVCKKTCPQPPVASSVTGAKAATACAESNTQAPWHRR